MKTKSPLVLLSLATDSTRGQKCNHIGSRLYSTRGVAHTSTIWRYCDSMNLEKLSALPAPVREHGRFCCWRYEARDGRKTKMPFDPQTGKRARSNDPSTFTSFPVATMEAESGSYNGVGVGIFGDLAAIDLDHCLTETGLAEWAQDIITTMHAYTEISPSGAGIRILFPVPQPFEYDKGRFYINRRINRETGEGVEIYIAGATQKYVTLTGDVFPLPFDTTWGPRNAELLKVLERYMVRERPEQVQPLPQVSAAPHLEDAELIRLAQRAKNGAAFSRLWSGDWSGYPSHSEADMALCNSLAFWTNRDPEQMDRLFRQSGLMRDKWDRRQSGSSYGRITIRSAIENCREVFTPRSQDRGQALDWDAPITAETDRTTSTAAQAPAVAEQVSKPLPVNPGEQTVKPLLVRASDVPYEPPRWLIRPYLQKGKGTLIQADNGTGKTAFVCAIAAHVSTGKPLLGISVTTPGNVLLLSVEDDLPVLRGRIEASGGDLDKCHFVISNKSSLEEFLL